MSPFETYNLFHMHIGFPYEAKFLMITYLYYGWNDIHFPIPKTIFQKSKDL